MRWLRGIGSQAAADHAMTMTMMPTAIALLTMALMSAASSAS
jgi:hypothetical protein